MVHTRIVARNTAGVDVEIRRVVATRSKGLATLLQMDQVTGPDEMPRHAGLGGLTRLVKEEQVEDAVLLPGDDVANPSSLRLVENR